MRHRIVGFLVAALAAPSLLAAQSGPAADLRRQVFVAESNFAATMVNRDLKAFTEFLSPETIWFGRTPLRGKDAVITAWRRFFDGPKAPFSWRPETVEVLPSGNLALTSGPVFDPDGKMTNTFTTIWRLDPDGKWRVIYDKGCPIEK